MTFPDAIILGIVEGLTEFLPVSSTGHLIIAGEFLKIAGPAAATFEIFIQLGAILAVALLYRQRFASLLDLRQKQGFAGLPGLRLLFLTTLPALLIGALAHGFIKRHLFNSFTVTIGLLAGGIAILLMEKLLKEPGRSGLDSIAGRDALLIGLFQCLAMWPGVSRSAATILGAMALGFDRKSAAEYSFLAAVPVICAATLFDLYKSAALFAASDLPFFAAGFIVSFVSAWFAVKFFLRLISTRTLAPFGWYRVAVSPLLFWTLHK